VSTIQQIKSAATKLSKRERDELLRWLTHFEGNGEELSLTDWFNKWQQLNAATHAAVGERRWTREDLHAR
jgi:hypothetical protein